jgi:type II secretory pathway component GspD/PulD (secretin)
MGTRHIRRLTTRTVHVTACLLALALLSGGVGCGGGGGAEDPCTLLPDVDRPASPKPTRRLMVELEVRFLSVDDGFLDGLGVDLDLLAPIRPFQPGVDDASLGTYGDDASQAVDPWAAGGMEGLWSFASRNQPRLSLMGFPWFGLTTPVAWVAAHMGIPGPGCTKFKPGYTELAEDLSFEPSHTFLPSIVGIDNGIPAGTVLGLRDLLPTDIAAIMQAAETARAGSTLTAPKVTCYDQQQAAVQVASDFPYIGDVPPEFQQAVNNVDPTWDDLTCKLIAGPQLHFVPFITADRQYVQVQVHPGTQILGVVPDETFTLGGAPTIIQVPIISRADAVVDVTIPDKGTVLIGGLRELGDTQMREGVPYFDDIPIIGHLFQRTGFHVSTRNLLIIVTAEINTLEELE